MKIKLVFESWKSAPFQPSSPPSWRLENGDFHGGATFDGALELDADQEAELREAMERGYRPVFWVTT